MSEVKFACPVCGQHITADSRASGTSLECPTCFRKIIIPQAPTSTSNLIISAAQAERSRPPQAEVASSARRSRRGGLKGVIDMAIFLVVLGAAGAVAYHYRDRLFKKTETAAPSSSDETSAEAPGPGGISSAAAAAASNVVWTLDVAKADVPGGAAAGRIHGDIFVCDRAVLQGGVLTLRKGRAGATELGVTINLPATQGEELSGKTILVTAGQTGPVPRVVLRWREATQKTATLTVKDGYSLKLEFEPALGNHIAGKVYICTPDEWKSAVAGTFTAEIRKPAPPKPRPPNASDGSSARSVVNFRS
jgi:hypothetical protein